MNEEMRDGIEQASRHLYGLIHARFIITSRGLTKMIDKYKKADFGRCPRVLCYGQALLPVGLSDVAYQKAVKLYCPRCEDIYSPKSSRHGAIDGAYFGSTFPHMLFMVHPQLVPAKTTAQVGPLLSMPTTTSATANAGGAGGQGGQGTSASNGGQTGAANAALKAERYRPRVFGFQLHEVARLQRWQEAHRNRCAPPGRRPSWHTSSIFSAVKSQG
jgi:casein kinase II subunit beta